MARTFTARDLIQLPRMDAHTLDVFARKLLAQYRPHAAALRDTKVPGYAAALRQQVKQLGAALASHQSQQTNDKAAAALDPIVDSTWAALVMFLEAFARLAWRPQGVTAQGILDAVFPDRLKFTQKSYFAQWSAANAKLSQLHGPAAKGEAATFVEQIEALGGELFLDEIQDKHAQFARVLGVTEAALAPNAVDVRTPYDSVLGAAKEYIAAIVQLDGRDVTAPNEVKHALLHVIEEFEPSSRRAGKGEGGATDEKPADGPNPSADPSRPNN